MKLYSIENRSAKSNQKRVFDLDIEDLLTSQEAGKVLGLTPRQITGLCNSRELPGAIKRGNVWLIPKISVEIYWKTKQRKKSQDRGVKRNEQ